MQIELCLNCDLGVSGYGEDPVKKSCERGAAIVEVGLCIPLIIMVFIALTEIGFLLMSRHALDLAAGQALTAGTILPLGNSSWETLLEDAPVGPCNSSETLSETDARSKLLCLAGVIARTYLANKELISAEEIKVQARMERGVEHPIDGPTTGILSIKVISKHKWFFATIIPSVTISGTKSARYIFAPY